MLSGQIELWDFGKEEKKSDEAVIRAIAPAFRITKNKTNKIIDSDYDSQVIIDFVSPRSFSQEATSLAKKWADSRGEACDIISGANLLSKTWQLNFIDNKKARLTRIYIIAHGKIFSDFLFQDHFNKTHYTQLADALAFFIGLQNVVINLLVCSAGKGRPHPTDSFGAKLYVTLATVLQRDIPVVARTSDLSAGPKFFSAKIWKQTLDHKELEKRIHAQAWKKELIHKQPGSKMTFSLDEEGKLIAIDSYKHKARPMALQSWRRQSEASIKKALSKTAVLEKKLLLDLWVNLFSTSEQEEDLYHIIKAEWLKGKNSVLTKESSSFFNPRHSTKTSRKIEKIVEEGMKLFELKFSPPDESKLIAGDKFKIA